MRRDRLLLLGIGLVALSAALYAVLFAVLGRPSDILFYTWLDIAFIPIEVLLVGLVINRLLAIRERRALLHKLNMVIGAFFSEVGRELLGRLSAHDTCVGDLCPVMHFNAAWSDADFMRAEATAAALGKAVDSRARPLEPLRDFIVERRPFLLGLLQNPNLLEHERFTELLWAVTHLSEELAFRPTLQGLPQADMDHLSVDMARAYSLLVTQWLEYVQHLKNDYPYLYSLAMRTNPLDPEAHVEID